MKNDIILKVENVAKQYRLGLVGTGTISHDLNRWWHRTLGKEDPYLKVGESNDRSSKGESDYVWAIKDINFEVKRGEVLGIIGKNGAGKSTLLKILSRVTSPTTGEIKTKGRIASLLEVGTGFHPEMTGRENIYLNGAILGMTKAEINDKIEEIIEFSGCLRYVDTPVKRYSSGMKVRLAFAVAAHLEPDILVVDEVLAVGDAEFQKKAIGKMQDISNSDGRTVLFVSHNMAAVKNLCTRCVVLENGKSVFEGVVDDAINYYMSSNSENIKTDLTLIENRRGNGVAILNSFHLENENGILVNEVFNGGNINLCFTIKVTKEVSLDSKIDLGFSLHSNQDDKMVVLYSSFQNEFFQFKKPGEYLIKCGLKNISLNVGQYFVKGRIICDNFEADFPKTYIGSINVIKGDFFKTGNLNFDENPKVLISGNWSLLNNL